RQPRTMHRAVRKLPPGHTLLAGANGMEVTPFWRAEAFEPAAGSSLGPAQIAGTLEGAVRRELMADVPLGVFISGGIDSSLLLAMAAPHFGRGGIFTYTVAFGDASYDESGPAAGIAQRFGTTHRIVDC